MNTRRYSWKPSKPDHRDHLFTLTLAALPDHVDPLGGSDPVEDQGQLGACTGHASTTALEIVTGRGPLSRLMAYYDGRKYEGTTRQDAGAEIRDVIKGLTSYGCASEPLWPYDVKKFATKPSAAAYKDAKGIIPKVRSYERVTTLAQFKAALASGLPVIFGFSVPDYFESDAIAESGWVPFPSKAAKIIGGHAVCAIGYDDRAETPFVWVRNSWGASWGLGGNFRMPYAWFSGIDSAAGLVSDCWVIHPAE